MLDESRGIEWTTWFTGRALNVADACVHRWARERSGRGGRRLGSRGGRPASLTWAQLSHEVRRLAEALRATRRRAGRRGRNLPADGTRGGDRLACVRAPRRRSGADLLRVRRAAVVVAARGRRREGVVTADASYRRRAAVPMKEFSTRRSQMRRRSSTSSSGGERASTARCRGGRDLGWDEIVADEPGTSPLSRSRARRPTSSRTRRGRPVVRRARSTSRAASSSRSHARPHTRPISGPAIACSSRPTWAGSWGRGPSSGAGVRSDDRLHGGRAGLARRPHLGLVETERSRCSVSRHARPRAHPEGRARRGPDVAARRSSTTGEPWNRGPYDWLDEHVCGKGRIPIVNCSGGTEVGACFLSVTPMRPTKPCSLGFPALGQDMDVFDDRGTRCAARSASSSASGPGPA